MSLLFLESFDDGLLSSKWPIAKIPSYTAFIDSALVAEMAGQLANPPGFSYPSQSWVTPLAARTGQAGLQVPYNGGVWTNFGAYNFYPVQFPELYVGFAVRIPQIPTTYDSEILSLMVQSQVNPYNPVYMLYSGDNIYVSLVVTAGGGLKVRHRGVDKGTVAPFLQPNKWYYIELGANIQSPPGDGSTSTSILRVDGKKRLTSQGNLPSYNPLASPPNSQPAAFCQMALRGLGSYGPSFSAATGSELIQFDDIYVSTRIVGYSPYIYPSSKRSSNVFPSFPSFQGDTRVYAYTPVGPPGMARNATPPFNGYTNVLVDASGKADTTTAYTNVDENPPNVTDFLQLHPTTPGSLRESFRPSVINNVGAATLPPTPQPSWSGVVPQYIPGIVARAYGAKADNVNVDAAGLRPFWRYMAAGQFNGGAGAFDIWGTFQAQFEKQHLERRYRAGRAFILSSSGQRWTDKRYGVEYSDLANLDMGIEVRS